MWKWTVRARLAAGASRWKKTPEIIDAIEILLEHDTAGDPITGLKWTRKTTEKSKTRTTLRDRRSSAADRYPGLGQYGRSSFVPNGFLSARQPQADRHQLQSLPRSAIPAYLLAAESLPAPRSSDHQRR